MRNQVTFKEEKDLEKYFKRQITVLLIYKVVTPSSRPAISTPQN